jgi:hypothetical protein
MPLIALDWQGHVVASNDSEFTAGPRIDSSIYQDEGGARLAQISRE